MRTYRNRIFSVPRVHLRFAEDDVLEYEVSISIPTQPASTVWTISMKAGGDGSDEWSVKAPVFSGYPEDSLRGPREVLALPGEEAFPAAVVLVDHSEGSRRIVAAAGDYRQTYPEGVPDRIVAERSNREEIERLRSMRTAHKKALQGFLDDGIPEGEARLLTIKEMQRLGYYPKPVTVTAVRLDAAGSAAGAAAPPRFTISEMEFRVGLFRDIAEAIASPGTAVEKGMGQYVRHRDFDTSEKINGFLKNGGTVFRVARGDAVFEITVRRPGREY